MLYRMDRRMSELVRELHGSCELLASEAEGLEYQLRLSMRGRSCKEILRDIQDEALIVVGMCEHVRVMLERGAGVCLS